MRYAQVQQGLKDDAPGLAVPKGTCHGKAERHWSNLPSPQNTRVTVPSQHALRFALKLYLMSLIVGPRDSENRWAGRPSRRFCQFRGGDAGESLYVVSEPVRWRYTARACFFGM